MNIYLGILIFIFGLCLGVSIVFVLWLMETSRELNDCEMRIAIGEAEIKYYEKRIDELNEILKGENHE